MIAWFKKLFLPAPQPRYEITTKELGKDRFEAILLRDGMPVGRKVVFICTSPSGAYFNTS
jgi:hypothetical protein